MNDEHDFAFPQHWQDNDGNGGGYFGLSKREYFAGLAMQGMCASWPEGGRVQPEKTAEIALCFADALIAALNTEPQP